MALVVPAWVARLQRPIVKRLLASSLVVGRLSRSRSEVIDGHVLDPASAAMLGLDDLITKSADSTNLGPRAARLEMRSSIIMVNGDPPPGVLVRDLAAEGPAGAIPLRLYEPPGLPAPSPGVVFFHGGGWVTGDLETHDSFCRLLAVEARARVVAVDYRLAPEHPFPAAVDDAIAAYRYVAKNAAQLGIDSARIGLTGDSAGGNLTMVVAQRTRGDSTPPAFQAPLYGATDSTRSFPSHNTLGARHYLTREKIDWYFNHYVPRGESLRNPDLSPIYREDLGGQCPALVVTAGFDPLRDEAHAYADRLRAAGVPVEVRCFHTLLHGFILMTGALPAARAATIEIARAIGAGLRRQSVGAAAG